MKVGILGSGIVGQALGAGFAALGHDAKIGSRNPNADKLTAWVRKTGAKASASGLADTAAFAEVAVLATPWSGTENAITLAGAKHLAGKVVIDVTNPLQFAPNSPPTLAVSGTDSAGERIQRWLPGAKVVKAFNIVGNTLMFRPQLPGGPPDMFICGNDAGAKDTVTGICTAFGWNVSDIGGIESSRYLEGLAMVWILHGFRANTWNHAFKLLRQP